MKAQKKQIAKCVAIAIILCFVSSTIVNAAESDVTTILVPHDGQPAAAKVDAKGTIHLLFHSSHGPQYVRSLDNGKSFSEPIFVIDRESQKSGVEFDVWDVAVDSDCRVHVALGTNAWKLKLPKDQWGFFYARLDPKSSAFTPVRNINHKPSEGFSLATDDAGKVTACWLADKLYANVSSDHGETFSDTAEIDPSLNPCNCCTTSAAYGADGKLAVLYREETDNKRDMYLVLWDQEKGKSSRTLVSSTPWKIDTCPMTYYSVRRDGDGFVLAWPTKGEVYFGRIGAKDSNQSPIEIKTTGTTGTRSGIVALSATNGDTVVAWRNEDKLQWQVYDSRGRTMGSPGTAGSSGKGIAGVVTTDGQFIFFR